MFKSINKLRHAIIGKKKISGHVDRCDKKIISGWAFNHQNSNEKVSLEIFANDKLLATCVADGFREDLKQAGFNDGCHSFSLNMGELLEANSSYEITIYSKGSNVQLGQAVTIDLTQSDVELEPKLEPIVYLVSEEDSIVGHLGKPEKNTIRGWVEIVNDTASHPTVELLIDGQAIGSCVANVMRDDVKQKRGGTGECGFAFDFPSALVPDREYTATVRCLGKNKFTFNKVKFKAPKKLSSTVTKQNKGTSSLKRSEKFRGHFDSSNFGTTIKGWASSGENSGEDGSVVSLFANGKKVSDITAKIYRKDLEKANVNKGYAGFEYSMPMNYVNGREYLLELRDVTGQFLIASKKQKFIISRDYTDYDGFLKWSFFHREVKAPFREEDKRCFAYMDWLEKFNKEKYEQQFEQRSDHPLVSIVMPTYNRVHIIERAINSVIAQSYSHWELIIVDDGSNDGTKELIESLDNNQIRYVESEGNQGVSVARNTGLELSNGQYITYLDSDNDWRENYLLMMIGGMENNPEFDCAYTGQYLFKSDDETPCAIRIGLFNRTLLENRNYIDMNAFCHRCSLVESKGGFDTNLRRLVDWDLILRYTEDKKPLVVENILSNYYFNQEQGTITISEDLHAAIDSLNENRLKERKEFDLSYDSISYLSDGSLTSSPISSADRIRDIESQKLNASIIIVSYNIPMILKACVDSILRTTDSSKTEIILIDNCSDDETVKVVESYAGLSNVKVEFNNENLGFTAAVNQGIELSKPDNNIVLLNNDAITTSGWLTALENVVINDKEVGIVAPQQVLLPETKTLNTHAPYANKYNETDVTVSIHHDNLVIDELNSSRVEFEVDFIPFFCVYIPRSIINEVGLLDAKLGRHYRSDRLYCYAVRYQANKKITFTPKSKLYHLHQQSTSHLKKKDDKEFDTMFVKNKWEDSNLNQAWDF
ncbi:glycosyltransferase [uncultured Vibrio sp.]|uniref:glycosyltransferase n=1 Tax=uncultured Vibrio sp. TaxID=114054 RepID=UPI0009234FD7|nr:glycosyltransferase [uncultured Vibrio sp.]OIQ25372.1 MAG: hypothetical protein BM561_06305 [Vibrio sp. MedPE-SWchi]